jgi:hypothetical protein
MAARVTKVSIKGGGKVLEVLGEAAISPNLEKVPATGRPTMPFMSSLRLTICLADHVIIPAEKYRSRRC